MKFRLRTTHAMRDRKATKELPRALANPIRGVERRCELDQITIREARRVRRLLQNRARTAEPLRAGERANLPFVCVRRPVKALAEPARRETVEKHVAPRRERNPLATPVPPWSLPLALTRRLVHVLRDIVRRGA